jgi:hypothetical protein
MNLDEIKRRIQAHFSDGLVTIVGSGYSAAFGLPTMPQLAERLKLEMASSSNANDPEWLNVVSALDDEETLETALDALSDNSPLITEVVALIADAILAKESVALAEIAAGRRLGLSELIKHIAIDGQATIITTNYDRLVEFAVELAGYAVENTFLGEHVGVFDPERARQALHSDVVTRSRSKLFVKYRPHIRIRKPHGSLDWYERESRPIRCVHRIDLPRLMITPGSSKYLLGYALPFDRHRELANREIDSAARFLAIGFGFNDEHLQTHLGPRISAGVPTLILARTLTDAAREVLGGENVIAIERCDSATSNVYVGPLTETVPIPDLWTVEVLIDEVLT